MNVFLAILISYIIGSMDWPTWVELMLCFFVWVIVVVPLTKNQESGHEEPSDNP